MVVVVPVVVCCLLRVVRCLLLSLFVVVGASVSRWLLLMLLWAVRHDTMYSSSLYNVQFVIIHFPARRHTICSSSSYNIHFVVIPITARYHTIYSSSSCNIHVHSHPIKQGAASSTVQGSQGLDYLMLANIWLGKQHDHSGKQHDFQNLQDFILPLKHLRKISVFIFLQISVAAPTIEGPGASKSIAFLGATPSDPPTWTSPK